MNQFKNQRGMIDIVLILVVFVLAAGLGGYVYYRQQQANKVYNAAGSGATVTKHTKAKSSAHSSDLLPPVPTSGGYDDPAFLGKFPGPKVKVTSTDGAAIKAATGAFCSKNYPNGLNGQNYNSDPTLTGLKIEGNFAGAGADCSHSALTYVKFSDGWAVVWGDAQESPCSATKSLVQYQIPIDVQSCYDEATQKSIAIR